MPPSRLVFVTGATGFLGSRLARRLAARGDRVRCLVRESSDTADLERIGAELVRGDAGDEAALAAGLAGADLAYHLAAGYDVGVVDEVELTRVNVGGTKAFLDAARRAGTPKLVYVSTTAALGPAPAGEAEGSEDTDYRGPYPSAYHRTKAEAHRLAREAQRRSFPLVIVCPAWVYGPGDHGPGGRFVQDLLHRRIPGMPSESGWFSFVHVDDVVEGLVRAGDDGVPGRVYVLGGEARTFHDFAREVASLAGMRLPRLRFPVWLARATGSALDAVARVTGFRFPLTAEGVMLTSSGRWLHSERAAREDLGWSPRPLSAGLPETVAWHEARAARR